METMKAAILTYHSIDSSNSIISTAPKIFRRQMKFLRENDYNVISLCKLVKLFTENKPLLPKTVTLTFDDGFRNFYTEAFPVLEEYGFDATVFLVADFCGKHNDWAGNPPALPRSELLSWREIRELNEHGIEFGSHTRKHPDLTRISNTEAGRELTESKSIIEGQLGTKVSTFAYPFGKFNRQIKRLAEYNYAAACSVNLGKTQANSDFFSLARIDTYYLLNSKIFDALSTGTFDYYLRFRQMMRDCKSLVRGN
jgi:peptidoglycan/xylan/chitin deacetylase (PgdA/CDA1 family)